MYELLADVPQLHSLDPRKRGDEGRHAGWILNAVMELCTGEMCTQKLKHQCACGCRADRVFGTLLMKLC
jgi:hypothetical protein